MSRLQQVFSKGKAFIPFITVGDPSLAVTEQLVLEMAKAGADIIELGIPFSDPSAEGPVIQEADSRALAAGVTTDHVFQLVKMIRQSCDVPLVLMTYANPVFVYGTERFMQHCRECGVDGVIVPDVPFEEKEELLPYCQKYGITLISMIAPTSEDRIPMIVKEAEGFIYCVSSMGVTGVREELGNQVTEMVSKVKAVKDIPCAVGFGIGTPQQAAEMAAMSDGVIVGSAIVQLVAEYGEECIPRVVEYVRQMKEAIN
jgi:tryptophan synthase alpha chain